MSGDRELYPEDPYPISSCWLEACPEGTPGATSPTEWSKLLDRLEEIMQDGLGKDVALGEFTSRGRGEGNAGMLQVSWALYVKHESRVDDLPLYTQEGEQIIPESLAEVPFGRPVHVLFYLWSYGDQDESAQKIAAAEYCFMQFL
ncbi:hypothetical protein OH76DRAFT_1490252 [Lentinus brumalis]|uniref:Uncharacterized protein n=1 Tax=Lentinus brumalis TaxID=2498619 RepID=A0A371CJN1_9APHY|nr:hypothetical protein OH76DRAFT_1490252 [Polyporus brumalis]